jgi:predicted GIY-YIG superfamily endonuclease
MYYVYWIRHTDHSDVMSQGYCGITKDLFERIRSHRKNRKLTKLSSFLKKYSWNDEVQIEILDMNLSLDEALALEAYYRPSEGIGLNLQRGGELGVNPEWYSIKENSLQHSVATSIGTREGIRLKDSTEARRSRAIKAHIDNAASYNGNAKGSRNPKALLVEGQVACIKHELIPNGLTNRQISDQYSVHPRVIQFIRSGKNWKHV